MNDAMIPAPDLVDEKFERYLAATRHAANHWKRGLITAHELDHKMAEALIEYLA